MDRTLDRVIDVSAQHGNARPTVLVVEDDVSLLKGLELSLKKEGYEVLRTESGDSAIRLAVRHKPDLIVLDLMLPDMSGLDVCRAIRQQRIECAIVMLTVKSEELDRVLGLEIGADDYVVKPFSIRELLARVRAHLRRQSSPQQDEPSRFAFADVEIDFNAFSVQRRGAELLLTTKEFELLRFLVAHRGEVLTRDRLLQCVWGYNSSSSTRTVDSHMLRLRQKLEANPAHPRHLLSVYGEGYKFVA